MTDRKKILHTVEVLKVIEGRVRNIDEEDPTAIAINILDLIKLLEKPHKTDGIKSKELSTEAVKLANRLFELIVQRKSNFRKVDLCTWSYEMDKILCLDGRIVEQVEELIEWCQQDDFWQNNILSPNKLRVHLDRLELQMSRDHKWQRNHSLMRQSTGKTAKEKYMEVFDEKNQGDDERSHPDNQASS